METPALRLGRKRRFPLSRVDLSMTSLNRTFGCVRVVWNRTLAWRQVRYRDGRLLLAKMSVPLAFTWSWPHIDPATLGPVQ